MISKKQFNLFAAVNHFKRKILLFDFEGLEQQLD